MNEENMNGYSPDIVSPPGDTVEELLEERGMSQSELAERMGRPKKTINEIIQGKASITPETALQFSKVFSVPADFWNNREAHYQQYQAQVREDAKLKREINWAREFPIREMVKRDLIVKVDLNSTALVREVLSFFGVASPEQWAKGWTKHRLAFRRSTKFGTDLKPLATWLRQGEIEAEKIETGEFNQKLLAQRMEEVRKLTNERNPASFIPKIMEIYAACGVAVVFVPAIRRAPVSGVARWLSPKKALIQLSARGMSDDHLWFTLFHETGHILKHSKKEIFVDLTKKDHSKKQKEDTEADHFAAELLVPSSALDSWLSSIPTISRERIQKLSSSIGIAPGIVVGRLQHLGKIPFFSNLNKLKVGFKWD